jgi:hypothetical protein
MNKDYKLNSEQIKYLTALSNKSDFYKGNVLRILKCGTYSADDKRWLNEYRVGHAKGTEYEIR